MEIYKEICFFVLKLIARRPYCLILMQYLTWENGYFTRTLCTFMSTVLNKNCNYNSG